MRWIIRTVVALFAILLIVFWLLPPARRTMMITWTGALISASSSVYLSYAYRHLLGSWRGFGSVTALSFLALGWLRWQWSLWSSPVPLLQNINVVVSLLAWALLIALFTSSVLLLIHKDASVVFMGLAWLLIPLVLLAVSTRYGRLDQFSAASLGEQAFWGVPLLWAIGMLCLGPLAFLGHLMILLVKESKAR